MDIAVHICNNGQLFNVSSMENLFDSLFRPLRQKLTIKIVNFCHLPFQGRQGCDRKFLILFSYIDRKKLILSEKAGSPPLKGEVPSVARRRGLDSK